jgi:plastocyanin
LNTELLKLFNIYCKKGDIKMKKIYLFPVIFLFLLSFRINAATWVIETFDFEFSPANLQNVLVGDTIKWQWLGGFHTTTSTSVPTGAAAWDSPLDAGNQTFTYVVTVAGTYNYKCTPHFPNMVGSFTANVIGISPITSEVPQRFELRQNYPNPFNPATTFRFRIPEKSFVKLVIYNSLGAEIETLVDEELPPAVYEAEWDASNYPSGIYFYRIETLNFSNTKKMILAR